MVSWYSNLLEGDHRRAKAVEVVLTRFEKQVARSEVHTALCGVIAEVDEAFIVRVCYGHNTKPPSRKWYLVQIDKQSAELLAFDDVRQYGEKPWR
jgi:hypothetical protein